MNRQGTMACHTGHRGSVCGKGFRRVLSVKSFYGVWFSHPTELNMRFV